MIRWRIALASGLALLCASQTAAAEEPIRSAQVWLIPAWEQTDRTRSYVSILNVTEVTASVTCHVYAETGAFAERASQTKTYAVGASRSNEGGSVPCAFAFAGATHGWAAVVSPTPILVSAQNCTTAVVPVCTPMQARPVDCNAPGGMEAVCRHAPRTLLVLPRDVRDHLRDSPVPRP